MKIILSLVAIFLIFSSCEKDNVTDKFLVGYSFINKNDYRRLGVIVETITYFPVEDTGIYKSQYFVMTEPDTFSMIVTNDENLLGYKGCRKHYNFCIRIYENLPGDSIYYSYFTYRLDTVQEVFWQTINNMQEGNSTFIWPDDTAKWFKLQEYHDKWINNN